MWVYTATNPDDNENIPHTKYSNDEGSSARAQIYAGWKVSGMEQFKELQKMVKRNRTTDAFREFEKDYLTKWQQPSSNTHRCIIFRNQEVCAIIESDLAGEDLVDHEEVSQTEVQIGSDGMVLNE
jgi:hypothetical protein